MLSNKPLVSVGLPVYNGEKTIETALDSLLAQDYKDFELIISENASTDRTLEICQRHSLVDSRIRISRKTKTTGALENFISVLQEARGKYFMWASADDYWSPEFISSLVKELEDHPDAGVAMCATERLGDNSKLFDIIRFTGKANPNEMNYFRMALSLASTKKYNLYFYGLFRTKLLKDAAKQMPNTLGLDRLFICQVALATHLRYVDKPLYVRKQHSIFPSEKDTSEGARRRASSGKFVDFRIIFELGKTLILSNIIPLHRKVITPLILLQFLVLRIYSRILELFVSITKLLVRIIPEKVKNKLRK